MYARVKRTLLNEIFALTVCLWLKGGNGPGIGTPFSYSVPGQANELVLIEWGNNPMELLVNDKVKVLSNNFGLKKMQLHSCNNYVICHQNIFFITLPVTRISCLCVCRYATEIDVLCMFVCVCL